MGTRGSCKEVKASIFRRPEKIIQAEITDLLRQGFAPIPPEDHAVLMVEFTVNGMGAEAEIGKRHRLEERLNETLGWTGLGACDGGSIGNGTMEVCSFVVDFEIAKSVIETDLKGTEFSDYARIYQE